VGHINVEYNAGFSLSVDRIKLGVRHFSRFEAVKKPSRKLIDRKTKQGKLGA